MNNSATFIRNINIMVSIHICFDIMQKHQIIFIVLNINIHIFQTMSIHFYNESVVLATQQQ